MPGFLPRSQASAHQARTAPCALASQANARRARLSSHEMSASAASRAVHQSPWLPRDPSGRLMPAAIGIGPPARSQAALRDGQIITERHHYFLARAHTPAVMGCIAIGVSAGSAGAEWADLSARCYRLYATGDRCRYTAQPSVLPNSVISESPAGASCSSSRWGGVLDARLETGGQLRRLVALSALVGAGAVGVVNPGPIGRPRGTFSLRGGETGAWPAAA